jgi:hypothetical protein
MTQQELDLGLPRVHRDRMGCYHPVPGDDVAWTGHNTCGPSCDACGACDCGPCDVVDCGCSRDARACECANRDADEPDGYTCIGLSFAYCCLDGGETLCPKCYAKAGGTEEECDCP